ncbi:MAG: choice-of-anchor B family protein [Planctomycetota bacterium]|jgi:choice-of-anchor B domain-containing protein
MRIGVFVFIVSWGVGSLQTEATTPCACGMADVYPCSNVDLLSHVSANALGGSACNDIWGWTDPTTGQEYALMGLTSGTSFVDISDPVNPVVLGVLPSHTGFNSSWRDIKTFGNYAYVVTDSSTDGMQVFDLTELRNVASPPVTFTESNHYAEFASAHNIVINEDSGYAYAVGSNTCGGGLHMISLSSPLNPVFAGCFSSDGYTHDAQCVIYDGSDPDHAGSEICFCANEDTLTIVDVTNKSNPIQLARVGYSGSGYAHQGWLTEDHNYFLLGDELDEFYFGGTTRTYLWDLSDLDAPLMFATHHATTAANDHNLYIRGQYTYQANYRAGLRILDSSNIGLGTLTEVAHFDVHPEDDNTGFNGAWSVYPYFDNDVVIVSSIERGLFVLRPGVGDEFLEESAGHFTSCLTGPEGTRTPDCDCVDHDNDGDVDLADSAVWTRGGE